jgi:hypothetical protein
MVPMKTRRLLLPALAAVALLGSAAVATSALAVAQAPALISHLSVKDKANATHWSIQAGLAKGKKAYGDATATFTAVPKPLAGAAWIRDADKSRTSKVDPLVTFTLGRAADVYVGLDSRAVRPAWLDTTWAAAPGTEKVSGGVTYALLRKHFAAGTVALGPQGSAKTAKVRMYTIAVVPATVAANDFSVTVTPAGQSVTPGQTATYTVHTAVVSGKPDAIALTASPGTATVTPASVPPGGSAVLKVTTKTTDSGTVTIAVTGKDSFATHTASVTLTVGTSTGTTYEAEATSNTLFGAAKRRACAFCSGGGEVGNILGHGSSDALQFNGVTAPADGTYNVTWWYIAGDPNGDTKCGGEPNPPKQGCRPGDLVVNGVSQGIFQFPDTPNWHTLGSMTVKLKLKAGTNTIKISSRTADVADIDRIVVEA